MMKVTRLIFGILAAVTLPLLSCTREIVEVTPPQESEGQSLHISIGSDFTTKSALTNTGASQHIEHMYAYLFRQESGNDDFTCFYAVDMDWTPVDGTGISDFSYRISRDAGLQAMGDQLIKVLVVAVDNHPETYNFPGGGADATHENDGIIGLPFDEAKAVIASAVAGEDGTTTGTPEAEAKAKAWAMAHTELFSGSTEAVPANTPVIEVTIDRCVAGVLCYLTDIPYLVKSGEEDSKIQSIELRLNSELDLNTSMTLGPETTGSGPLYEKAQAPKPIGGVVIASVDVSMYSERQGDSGQQGGMLYIPATDDGTVKTLENSILFGAYMVPIDVSSDVDDKADNSTLSIYLKGGKKSEWKSDPYRIKYASSTSTQPGVTPDDRFFSYSLLANRMYAIGTKPTSGDTEGDRPASLAGDELLLNVVDWVDVPVDDINTEFPQYAPGACFVPSFEDGYIFDCIGTGTDRLIEVAILPALDKESGWRLDVTWTKQKPDDKGPIPDWLLYRFVGGTEDSPEYSSWYSGTFHSSELVDLGLDPSSEIRMQVAMADYVVANRIMYGDPQNRYPTLDEKITALQDDYRTATFRLTTSGGRTDEMNINQYNAITSPVFDVTHIYYDYTDEAIRYVGFAREDRMAPQSDIDSHPTEDMWDTDGYSYTGWGYQTSGPTLIFGVGYSNSTMRTDGEQNAIDAYSFYENHSGSEYPKSAIYRGRQDGTAIYLDLANNSGSVSDGRIWFTPAETELYGFFEKIVKQLSSKTNQGVIPVVNIKYDKYYWSSSPEWLHLAQYETRAGIAGDGSDVMVNRDRSGSNGVAYIRQARNFESGANN